jgi:hypothetical protein
MKSKNLIAVFFYWIITLVSLTYLYQFGYRIVDKSLKNSFTTEPHKYPAETSLFNSFEISALLISILLLALLALGISSSQKRIL